MVWQWLNEAQGKHFTESFGQVKDQLQPIKTKLGYLEYSLWNNDTKTRQFWVHNIFFAIDFVIEKDTTFQRFSELYIYMIDIFLI